MARTPKSQSTTPQERSRAKPDGKQPAASGAGAIATTAPRGKGVPLRLPVGGPTAGATGKRVQGGEATTDAVLSARVGGNAEIFPDLMRLHVPFDSRVADITWGKGVFWKAVPDHWYEVLPSDIQTGTDSRDLPYDDGSLDAVIFDPPYMEGLFRRESEHMAGGGTHSAFRDHYSDGKATMAGGPKYHDAVLDLYFRTAVEVARVLRPGGVFVVKCQDEVSANKQRLTHVEIINYCEQLGFYAKDLFVVVRQNRPVVSRMKAQVHARKNHSYFLVFEYVGAGKVEKAKSRPANRGPAPEPPLD